MDFDAFIDQAWTDHADDAAAVAARLQAEGLALVSQTTQLPAMAHLAHHVFGAHLARWQEGIDFQQALAALPCGARGRTDARATAPHVRALPRAGGVGDPRRGAGASERIRLTAMAANHLAEHDATRAATLLKEALAMAETAGLPDGDPYHRALAIAGNNTASTLEEKPTRTAEEKRLMILAAQAGRRHWAIAGTWLETERAEYRLAMSWLKADDTTQARQHAQNCLEIVKAHDDVALEAFFGWEALGQVERAAGNSTGHAQAVAQAEAAFARLADSDKCWCQASLDKIKAVPDGRG